MEIGALLARHALFGHLDPRALADVAGRAQARRLARGEILALEGEPCDAVYLVVEGRVRALKLSPQGREQVVSDLGAGQMLYVVPALDGGPLPTTAQAATRATLLAWPVDDWLALLDRYPALARRLLVDFAGRLRRMADLVGELALYSVPERLARLLLEVAEAPPSAASPSRRWPPAWAPCARWWPAPWPAFRRAAGSWWIAAASRSTTPTPSANSPRGDTPFPKARTAFGKGAHSPPARGRAVAERATSGYDRLDLDTSLDNRRPEAPW